LFNKSDFIFQFINNSQKSIQEPISYYLYLLNNLKSIVPF
jgi:hypothetical protein